MKRDVAVNMFFVILCFNFFLLILDESYVTANGCISPPMQCPNEDVTFWLYTRKNEKDPHQLFAMDSKSIESAPWVKDSTIKIIIHGYTGHKDYAPNVQLRPAYMECCDYNLISVDYERIAREPCYVNAVKNTELVGMCTAQLIDELVKKHGFNLTRFHVIGFSLGGQVAGYVGNYVTAGQLPRITALDPALPLFVTTDLNKKIDKGDAKFVDVLHTNALEKGKLESSGHVDFYANGGLKQPGCQTTENQLYPRWRWISVFHNGHCCRLSFILTAPLIIIFSMSSCNHARAPILFAESIITTVGFYAVKCYSWITYIIGWCELSHASEEVLFGEYVNHNVRDLYFFSTNSEPPYARGASNRQ